MSISDLFVIIKDTLGQTYSVLIAIGAFVVGFGIFKFILHADDENERKTGRMMILWGIIGIFLMLSIWGLVNILVNTLPGLNTGAPRVPTIVPPQAN